MIRVPYPLPSPYVSTRCVCTSNAEISTANCCDRIVSSIEPPHFELSRIHAAYSDGSLPRIASFHCTGSDTTACATSDRMSAAAIRPCRTQYPIELNKQLLSSATILRATALLDDASSSKAGLPFSISPGTALAVLTPGTSSPSDAAMARASISSSSSPAAPADGAPTRPPTPPCCADVVACVLDDRSITSRSAPRSSAPPFLSETMIRSLWATPRDSVALAPMASALSSIGVACGGNPPPCKARSSRPTAIPVASAILARTSDVEMSSARSGGEEGGGGSEGGGGEEGVVLV